MRSLNTVTKGHHTITCKSKEVPTAESLAFSYHELIRASLLVCEMDRVSTYVPIPGLEYSDHVDRAFSMEYLIIVLVAICTVKHAVNLENITICGSAWCEVSAVFFLSLKDSSDLRIYSLCHRSRVLSTARSVAGEEIEAVPRYPFPLPIWAIRTGGVGATALLSTTHAACLKMQLRRPS